MALETLSTITAIVGGVIGAIGGTVGIVTSIRSSRRETDREIEEQNNFSFLAAFMQKQVEVGGHAGRIFISDMEIGSKEWERAEKLVERGILERGGPGGLGYRVRGFYERDSAAKIHQWLTGGAKNPKEK
jgi:hypothetical protein